MIIIRLEGGIGNQLFQYATGKALALRLNTEIILDISSLNRINSNITKREYELFNFQIDSNLYSKSFLTSFKFSQFFPSSIIGWNVYKEVGRNFNPEFLELKDKTYLIGYWQSFKYFSQISTQLMQELMPKKSLSDYSQDLVNNIKNSESVALHVRRGDYASSKTSNALHGCLPFNYYISAIKKMRITHKHCKFFIFSDDIKWCKYNLSFINSDVIIVEGNDNSNAWQDLILMSYCKHHILANSSFSWWGAWIADQRYQTDERTVLTPKNWFVTEAENINLADRFPSHWQII